MTPEQQAELIERIGAVETERLRAEQRAAYEKDHGKTKVRKLRLKMTEHVKRLRKEAERLVGQRQSAYLDDLLTVLSLLEGELNGLSEVLEEE